MSGSVLNIAHKIVGGDAHIAPFANICFVSEQISRAVKYMSATANIGVDVNIARKIVGGDAHIAPFLIYKHNFNKTQIQPNINDNKTQPQQNEKIGTDLPSR